MKARANKLLALFAMGVLGGVTMMLLLSQSAMAKPEFTVQTSKPCATCHQNPAGGGKLKPFGEAFKANGNKLPRGK